MEQFKSRYRKCGSLFFVIGTTIGILLSVGAVWANLEASFYGFTKLTSNRLEALRCPAYLTTYETGTISIRLTNTNSRTINELVRAQFSAPTAIVSTDSRREMPPGSTEVFAWEVDRNNIDLGQFIFASVYRFSNYPTPAQQAVCGIFVLPIPFISGFQFVVVMSLLCIAGMIWGWWLWEQGNKAIHDHSLDISRAMKFILVLVPLTMLVSLTGNWILGGILLVICMLMGVVTIRFFISA